MGRLPDPILVEVKFVKVEDDEERTKKHHELMFLAVRLAIEDKKKDD